MGNIIISAPCEHCFNDKHVEFIDKQARNALVQNLFVLLGLFAIKYGPELIELASKLIPNITFAKG